MRTTIRTRAAIGVMAVALLALLLAQSALGAQTTPPPATPAGSDGMNMGMDMDMASPTAAMADPASAMAQMIEQCNAMMQMMNAMMGMMMDGSMTGMMGTPGAGMNGMTPGMAGTPAGDMGMATATPMP